MTDWFRRFKHYPCSIIGHIAWGTLAGAVGADDPVNGVALLSGGYCYQFGSAWRKNVNTSRIDTVGLDSFDYAVGYGIGYAVRRFAWA